MQRKRCLQAYLTLLMLVCSMAAFAQTRQVTGTVTDEKTGDPLYGATIQARGTNYATVTDSTGKFQINVPGNASTLQVSSIGYASKEVPISGPVIRVQLTAFASSLDNVVVIGYGTVRKSDVTGAVNTLTTKDFQKGTVTSFDQMISGKATGVSITPNGGRPGAGSTILIRGLASLNGSNSPLQVVDGAPFDGYVNPNDIESVTILKDAASTAIYGSRASSGVILITTKSGLRGRPKINFNTLVSAGKVSNYVDVLNADEFRTLVTDHYDETYTALLGSASTDWQKEIYQTALTSNTNIAVSGTAKWLPYRISAGWLDQQGVLKTDLMQRGTASLKLTPSFFKKLLKVELNVNASTTKNRNANQSAISNAVIFDPTQSVNGDYGFGDYFQWLNADGTPNTLASLNPVALLMQQNDISRYNRAFGNLKLDLKLPFLPDLHLIANGGVDRSKTTGRTILDSLARNAYSATDDYTYRGSNHQYESDATNAFLEYTLNYTRELPNIRSNINAMATYGYYDYKSEWLNFATYDAYGALWPNTTPTYANGLDQHTLISYVGRLIYTYDDKYTLTASFRRDGSSRFAPANRWGTFPGVAVGWNIKKENFLSDVAALSDLKLRLSYGLTGNQDGISSYSYIPSYYLSNTTAMYQFGSTYYQMYTPSSYDAGLKWESTRSSNIGLDFGFFKNRLSGSIDLYRKYTFDMLSSVNLAAGTNFTNILTTNVGNMSSTGFELNLNAAIIRQKDIDWSVNFNTSHNESIIEKLQSTSASDKGVANTSAGVTGATGNYIEYNAVGNTPNSFLVYKQVYDAATGKPIEGVYADLTGDGAVTSGNDQYFYHAPYPKWLFGFSTNFRYKSITFNTVLRSNVGNYVYNNVAANLGTYALVALNGQLGNASRDIYNTGFAYRQLLSDYYIQNASFLKMDNISLTYDFGRVLRDHINLTLSANVQNVFTVTKYTGLNPEVYNGVDYQFYPVPRVYTLGLNLNF
ncbi:MAG: SusC/RagA family TonB-linked outer membrane protein [Niabella sp.]